MSNTVSSLTFKIESQQVAKATQRLDTLEDVGLSVDQMYRKLVKAVAQNEAQFRKLNEAMKGPISQYRQLARNTRNLTAGLRSVTVASNNATGAMGKATRGVTYASTKQQRMAVTSQRVTGALERETAAAIAAGAAMQSHGRKTAQASRTTRSMGRNVDVTAKGLQGIADRALAAGAAFLVFNRAQQVVMEAFDQTAALERIGKQLDFVFGGARQGAEAFNFVADEAMRTGQVLLDTAPLFAKFTFAMQQAGLTAEDAKAGLVAISNAAATFGLSASETSSILSALIQVASKGKLQAEEIRKQIGERLPGAFGIAARSVGATTREFSEMLETGDVLAKDFLPRFFTEMDRNFGGDIANKTDTLTASLNRLRTEVTLLFKDMDSAPLFRDFIEGIRLEIKGLRYLVGGTPFTQQLVHDLTHAFSDAETSPEFFKQLKEDLNSATFEELADSIGLVQDQMAGLREQVQKGGYAAPFAAQRLETLQQAEAMLVKTAKAVRTETLATEELNEAIKSTVAVSEQAAHGIDLLSASFGNMDSLFRDVESRVGGTMGMFQNFDHSGLGKSLVEDIVEATTLGFQDPRNREQLRQAAASAFDFSGVSFKVNINPFREEFEKLADSLSTPMEKAEEKYRNSLDLIRRYYAESNMEIDSMGRQLIARLDQQYEQDVLNWKEAQREKQIESSATAQAVVRITEGIEEGLVNAAKDGQAAFKEMGIFILAELNRILIKTLVLNKLYGAIGGFFGGDSTAIGSAFLQAGGIRPAAIGGYIPSGRMGLVGETGPEMVSGPMVVTSAKTTERKMGGSAGVTHNGPVINVSADMRGASVEAVQRLEGLIRRVQAETPAVAIRAVNNAYRRDPKMLTR